MNTTNIAGQETIEAEPASVAVESSALISDAEAEETMGESCIRAAYLKKDLDVTRNLLVTALYVTQCRIVKASASENVKERE